MNRLAIVAILLAPSLALAQGPSPALDRLEPTGAPDNVKLAGHALVWMDAALYLAPSEDAKAVAFGIRPGS